MLACDVRLMSFKEEISKSTFKQPQFGQPEKHFMTKSLKSAMQKLKELENMI